MANILGSASQRSLRNAMRRIGLGLIVGSLVLFLVGLGLVAAAI